ncbi:SIR2 family protein [Variovorax atrisoli]|uniref:SIR2 family protein n=1 Tax=Variovorax atrisoli TaxID=3394203 RepID=UPI00339889DD
MTQSFPSISASQFSTALALRPNLVAWFLGAGASAASGIPTGYDMIRNFKSEIFCRENNLSPKEVDTGDPVWLERIDRFFRQTSILPADGDPNEYAEAFEAVYPQPRHRRQYIDDAISKGTPCFGHRVLGSLIAAQKVDCVFTTNFDPLVEDAAGAANNLLPVEARARPTVAGIDSGERALRCLRESDWPLVAKLHGDYQSIAIKNTGTELEKQDDRMRHVLVEASQRFGLVFVGYSGRDLSVMDTLTSVLREPDAFPNGLYWVASSASKLLPAVTQFLEAAHTAGVDVAVVECKTFDELAADVIKRIDLPEVLIDHVMQAHPGPRLVPVVLPESTALQFPVLRYSALLIESIPRTARRITLTQSTTTPVVRDLLRGHGCKAIVAANGRELAVFGSDAEVMGILGPNGAKLDGTIVLDPARDSWALGLLYDALVKALSRYRPLIPRYKRSGHSLVVATRREGDDSERAHRQEQDLAQLRNAYGGAVSGTVQKLEFPFQEGVFLKLEQIEGRWWCGFEPYTFVDIPRAPETDHVAPSGGLSAERDVLGRSVDARGGDPAGDWRRERWAAKYNKNWASIIDAWAKLLTSTRDGSVRAFNFGDGEGVDAVFGLSPFTGWSRPAHQHDYFDRTK